MPVLYAFQNPTVYVDPDGQVALVDNLFGGVASVAVGFGIAKLTGEEYTAVDVAVDFGLGAATSGLSVLAKAGKIRKAARVVQEGLLDAGGEVVRKLLKDEEVTRVRDR